VPIPPVRYDHIQKLRRQNKWTALKSNYPTNNFDCQFRSIRKKTGIDQGEFHDFRRTCLTNWFANGLSEYDVMKMAGHSNFETTRTFYLAVRGDLVDRARRASSVAMRGISIANSLQLPSKTTKEKRPPSAATAQVTTIRLNLLKIGARTIILPKNWARNEQF